jgi:pyruvate/2-oxoglutarate dehydrogenase complex dihydrolipoamide dehydrogenase (E3) component
LGAGLVGVELGIYLSMLGKKVVIVEMLGKISDGGNMLHVRALEVEIKKYGIDLRLNTKAEEITEKGARAGGSFIPADTVVYAVGQEPVREAALALRDCAPEFWLLGDCIAPQNIMNARPPPTPSREGYKRLI